MAVYASCVAGLCAYNRSTGAPTWSENTVSASSIAIGGSVLYDADGSIVNASTGAVLTVLNDETASSVAVGDGRIAFTNNQRIIDLYGLSGS